MRSVNQLECNFNFITKFMFKHGGRLEQVRSQSKSNTSSSIFLMSLNICFSLAFSSYFDKIVI
jgi:hypothetical protein